MINFRYHVVSLTAVFLALAIGLVVGTAAGNGPVADSLSGQVATYHKQNQQFRDQIQELTDESNKQEQAWTVAASAVLQGRLANRRVLLVTMPSAAKYVDAMAQMLGTAGAKITGRMQIEDKFTDPASNDQLLDLALNASPAGIRGALPSHSNGAETSMALLAAVLVAGAPVDGTRTVLTAYGSQGYLSLQAEPTPAEAVVFLAGVPYTENDAAKHNAAVLTIAERFDQAGKIVVTTTAAAGDGNVVRAIRDDADLAKTASTVDNASTALGRFATVLALAEQIEGRVGHYGLGSGASAPMPVPAGTRDGT